MTVLREVHADGWCVRLDLGRQVLRQRCDRFKRQDAILANLR
jgi:hypothetical protein